MQTTANWKQGSAWTWREFMLLLLLEFGIVVWGIKHGLQPLYERWLEVPLYAGTLTGLTIAVVLLVGVYAVALRPHRLSWQHVGLRRFPSNNWPRILFWFLALTLLSIATAVITSFFGNSLDNSKTEALREQINAWTLLIGILSAGVISPVYEEIFYRGFIYSWLRTRTSTSLSMLISALIFTLAHYPTLNAMPVNFICGIIFAWTYERTGSVLPAMLIHGVFNTVAVILTVIS